MRRFCLLLIGIAVSTPICVFMMRQAKNDMGTVEPTVSVFGTASVTEDTRIPETTVDAVTGEGKIITKTVPGTPLVVLQYSAYEGPYMEDGSDREVHGVASVLLHNSGNRMIGCCHVFLQVGTEVQEFIASMLPPGKTAIVVESGEKQYLDKTPYGFRALIRNEDPARSVMDRLQIESAGMGAVRVTNRSQETLRGVRVQYKTTVPGEGVYIGGITYAAAVGSLEPGEGTVVEMPHFAQGYSSILWAEEN